MKRLRGDLGWLALLFTAPLWGIFGCSSPGEQAPEPDPVEVASTSGPLAQRLNKVFDEHYAQVQGMSYADLLAKHSPSYHQGLSFKVSDAEHYQGFVNGFQLSSAAQKTLGDRGFVVINSPDPHGGGPADLLYQVFAKDLPVFISADAILHAWHRTFDKVLERTEEQDLFDILTQLLDKTMAQLDPAQQAHKDALFYLAVARSMLDDSAPPQAVAGEVQRFLELIKGRQLAQGVEFMGVPTDIDFSQFIPRGHYTHSEKLEHYFMAMMWLGRTDLVLYNPDPGAKPRPREEAAARALAAAMDQGGALQAFQRMDRYYAAFVGKTNALTPERMLGLCSEAQLSGCAGSPAAMQAVYAKQPPPEYSSRVFAGAVPPICMRFFPQRFAYGAWVTTKTTTPRLKPAVQGGRAMAMPEDVAFVLGSDRAADYFAQEMQKEYRQNLPATLEAARRTMEQVPPGDLDSTIFNSWLEGLRALSQPAVDPALPQVMRTAQWHDRKLEAVLASWAELRHDTILIVEQSTGGIGCQYPKGYVEPVPALYSALEQAAQQLSAVYADSSWSVKNVVPCMTHWTETLKRLGALAQKELASQPMDESDLAFLNQTADMHGSSYYGDRMFDGWYPQLFWTPMWKPTYGPDDYDRTFDEHPSGQAEPLVADVHTDAENGQALEVATGRPGLMIVAIDNQGDLSLYGGPVASYYSFSVPVSERMTDEQWQEKVEQGALPQRPDFARSYWAD